MSKRKANGYITLRLPSGAMKSVEVEIGIAEDVFWNLFNHEENVTLMFEINELDLT